MYGADYLAEEIGEDINLLDQNVLHLKDLITKLGTKDDTPRLRHEMRAVLLLVLMLHCAMLHFTAATDQRRDARHGAGRAGPFE
jgi:hypothetical protein